VINRALLMLAICFWSFMGTSQTNNSPQKSGAEIMRELRLKILTTRLSELKIQPTKEYPRVYAILMDWPLGTNTITVFSSCVGDASIYTTFTFGVMGGIGQETVRSIAREFVKVGEEHYDSSVPAKRFPYPNSGHVFFYLICFDGIRMIDRDAKMLSAGNDKCSDLYNAGQRVLTELRLITETQKKKLVESGGK
jgi:hypothetical protein